MGEVIVFAGPCLHGAVGESWRGLLQRVRLWPPAQRGDVFRALCEEPAALVLLDGYFYDVPAVTHKELMYALDAGVPVIGAASMGALRAAELAAYGMLGVGRIFEWFRDGVLDGDDEVTILHCPESFAYQPISLALVDVRHAVAELTSSGHLRRGDGERLVRGLKALPFTERRLDRVRDLLTSCLGAAGSEALRGRLATDSLKRQDAEQALRLALDGPPPAPCRHRGRRPMTLFCNYFREQSLGPAGEHAPSFHEAWQMAQLFHQDAEAFVRAVRLRFLFASAAERRGLAARDDVLGGRVEGLRIHCLERFGRLLLPLSELVEEARCQALAELGRADSQTLGESFGDLIGPGSGTGPEVLVDRLESQGELMPPWVLVRAFVFTTALEPALEVARQALQIHRAFARWARGSRITEAELRRLAAELWACPPSQVSARAARRALFPSDGFSAGFREALERVAAAERLERPLNAYPESRERLRAAPLELASRS